MNSQIPSEDQTIAVMLANRKLASALTLERRGQKTYRANQTLSPKHANPAFPDDQAQGVFKSKMVFFPLVGLKQRYRTISLEEVKFDDAYAHTEQAKSRALNDP